MIIAVDKHGAIHVFVSTDDAERCLEAIDVQNDSIEFCDALGQRYSPTYSRPPKQSRVGPIGVMDIGAFRLVAEGDIDPRLPERFIGRAQHVEHTSISSVTTIEALRRELHKRE